LIIERINPEKIKTIECDFANRVNEKSLNFIKKNYNWNTCKILVINYSQPLNYCHFDNNLISKQIIKFFEDFYVKINKEDCLLIKVRSNGKRVSKN